MQVMTHPGGQRAEGGEQRGGEAAVGDDPQKGLREEAAEGGPRFWLEGISPRLMHVHWPEQSRNAGSRERLRSRRTWSPASGTLAAR